MTNKWNLDLSHSEIGFKVKHLMITNVSGDFKKFDASFESEGDDFTTAKVTFTAETASVETGNEQRNGHMLGPDFFDSETFPHMKFVSTKVEKKGDDEYVLHGDLTIKDSTKPVNLQVECGGVTVDPYGQNKIGFSISGKINRNDWGLVWNMPLAQGGLLVSEDVKILGEVQFVKQA